MTLVLFAALCLAAPTLADAQGRTGDRLRQDPVVTDPVPVNQPRATYTPAARAAGLVGFLDVQAVVRADGTVGEVRIYRSCLSTTPPCNRREDDGPERAEADGPDMSLGLRQTALLAAKLWTFRPARMNGVPIAVTVVIEMNFNLRDEPARDRAPSSPMPTLSA
jgi:hypothetical protein